jgi:hypothetical protein
MKRANYSPQQGIAITPNTFDLLCCLICFTRQVLEDKQAQIETLKSQLDDVVQRQQDVRKTSTCP